MKSPFPANAAGGLLAADLDGTLAFGGIIGPGIRRAADRARAAGIPILVVTGRNPRSIDRVEGIWDVADEILFSSGAGVLRGPDALPEEHFGEEGARLTAADVERIAAVLDGHGEDYFLLDPIPGNHRFAWHRNRPSGENPDFDARMDLYGGWGRAYGGSAAPACQVLAVLPPAGAPAAAPADLPALEADLSAWSVFRSSSPIDHASIWLEVFPAGTDKGAALAAWCAAYGIAADRVLALGNDFNDVPMLEWAGRGRVVPDAPAALRDNYAVRNFAEAVEEALEAFGGAG